ncbi:MAG: glycosyltransferase family 4 protein [Elusimicrobiota bacterium]|jgi:glycosyltransferase involved in cell wall biosynthesis
MYLTESMGWSGGAHQALRMAEALQKRGHDIRMACQPGSEILSRARSAGLAVEPVRMRQDYDVLAVWNVRCLLKDKPVDVLHAQHSTAHAIGLMAVAGSGVPVFVVTRRVIFPIKRNLFSKLKYLSRRINGYIAISEAVRTELQKAGVIPSLIEVVPSIVDPQTALPEEGKALRRELGLPEGPVVTTVANYADFKGQDYLLKAAVPVCQRFPKCRFLLAGRNTEQLQGLVRELGLDRFVHLLGFRTDVPRILAATTIYVQPSLQEGAGTALREAMIAGIPCIGSSVGGIPEAISDGETGLLVPPAASEALASAILRLLDQPEFAGSLARQGKTLVQERFSLPSAATQIEAFYQRLVEGVASR